MSKEEGKMNEKKPLDLVEKPETKEKKPTLKRLLTFVDFIFNKLTPNFAPKLILEEKLIDNEIRKDYAMIKYYSELQILLGTIIFIFG
ncbi:MAG: hypothetical protein GPJ54_08330, partial [Candidatus Heimdallarchaeota archaeon]|nr:hypothetical protein [Candidatus Heimdallarchaeota archaeon]